jgi:tetratricopeptide (TPR) repeat protein
VRPSYIPQSRPQIASRPNIGGGGLNNGGFNGGQISRPNIGGGGFPNISQVNIGGGGQRPNLNIGGGGGERPNMGGGGSIANRPDFGIGNRPNIGGDVRPDWTNRPGAGGGGVQRPDGGLRPDGGGNRPNGGGDRPNGGGDRPNGGGDRPNGGGNRPNGGGDRPNGGGNRPDNRPNGPSDNGNHNNNWNNNTNWNNNINHWANNHPNHPNYHPWYNHYDQWHDWHHGHWNYWGGGYPWAWFGAGAAIGWWASPDTAYVYDNPYYVEPAYADEGYYPDYSQPIAAPPVAETVLDQPYVGEPTIAAPGGGDSGVTAAETEDPATKQAVATFDAGRELFKKGDYQSALANADQAIKQLPSDTTLHEFRALCLFALKRYQESAAGVYAVLAAGPGWDWDSMKSLYPDVATYTAQLRALEAYKKAHPDETDASFLLAYHYLVMGYPDQAANELRQVVKLQPNDKLSAAILQALDQRNSTQQQPAPTPTGQ